jgi:hypothetical protein
MEKITGYAYIDQPASELLDKLPTDQRNSMEEIFKKIHSAGQADGYVKGKFAEKEQSKR